MSDSLSVYLNSVNSRNIFLTSTAQNTDESVEAYNFISKTYDPTIENTDEECEIILDEESKNDSEKEDDSNVLKNISSGMKTITLGTLGGVGGIVLNSFTGFAKNTSTGIWNGVKGLYTGLSSIGGGIWGGLKSFYSNSFKGIKQIFQGNFFKGIGSFVKGIGGAVVNTVSGIAKGIGKVVKGGVEIVKGVAKGIVSVGKAVGKGIAKVGKAIGKGIKKIFKGW